MADAPAAGQAPQQANHVVRGRPHRLVEVNDSQHRSGPAPARTRPAPARARRPAAPCTVQPAARAWPPPPKAEVIATASARSLVRTLTRVLGLVNLLEQDRDVGRLGGAQQVDEPLAGARLLPRLGQHGVGHGGEDDAAVAALADAGQHQAPQRQRAVRLVDVQGAVDRRQRRPGLHQLGRHPQGARRGVRVREGVRVLGDAGHQDRGQLLVDRHAQLRQQQRHHLAGGGGGRVDPDGRCRSRCSRCGGRRWPRGPSPANRPVRPPRLPVRARSPASTTTATSGSSAGAFRTWSMRGRKASSGGGGSALTTSEALPIRSAAMAMAMAAPSVSASGFSWQIAVTRCAERSSATTSFMSRPWWRSRPRCRAGCAAPGRRTRSSHRPGCSAAGRAAGAAAPRAGAAAMAWPS